MPFVNIGMLSDAAKIVAQSMDADIAYQLFSASAELILDHRTEFPVLLGHSLTLLVLVSIQPLCRTNYRLPFTQIATFVHFIVVPNCGDYVDCYGCASQEQCAWCASENLCTTISEAFSRDCRGLVFEPPCPNNFVSGKPKEATSIFVFTTLLAFLQHFADDILYFMLF